MFEGSKWTSKVVKCLVPKCLLNFCQEGVFIPIMLAYTSYWMCIGVGLGVGNKITRQFVQVTKFI